MCLNIFYEIFFLNKDLVKYLKSKWLLIPSLDPTHKYAYVGLVFILAHICKTWVYVHLRNSQIYIMWVLFILGTHKYAKKGVYVHLESLWICIMKVFFHLRNSQICITNVCFDRGSSQMQNDKFVNLTIKDLYHT